MTHTIHPKMLEKVARIINPTAFTDIPSSFLMKCPKGTDIEHAKKVYQNIIDPDRKLAYEKAEAAILAMWEGLPIEDAPKDGTGVLGVVDGKFSPVIWLEEQQDYYEGPTLTTWAGWHGERSFPGSNMESDTEGAGATGQPITFIPFPTQETE